MKNMERRAFLELGIKSMVFVPMAAYMSCNVGKTNLASPEDSLKKLIMISGPWPVEDQSLAEDFARRFLNAEHLAGQYLPKSASIIQQLAAIFPDDAYSLDDIEIDGLPPEERDVLVSLVSHIYDVNEIQFYLAGTPQWGACIGTTGWHTDLSATEN